MQCVCVRARVRACGARSDRGGVCRLQLEAHLFHCPAIQTLCSTNNMQHDTYPHYIVNKLSSFYMANYTYLILKKGWCYISRI